jgi:hypothetical protein
MTRTRSLWRPLVLLAALATAAALAGCSSYESGQPYRMASQQDNANYGIFTYTGDPYKDYWYRQISNDDLVTCGPCAPNGGAAGQGTAATPAPAPAKPANCPKPAKVKTCP